MNLTYRFSLLTVAAVAASCATAIAAESPISIIRKDDAGELTVYYKRQKALVYAFAPQQYKPYVRELYTLSGQNVLLDAPPDHLHHHGVMYAIKVNGLNFWEETAASGIERPVKFLGHHLGRADNGLPQASFTQLIHWIATQDKSKPDTTDAALLVERRTLTITINEPQNEVALKWDSAFTVGAKTNKVILTGSNYHGLGVRFPRVFDLVAKHRNSEKSPDVSEGKQDVSQAKWSAVSLDTADQTATIALFGWPENRRGDAHFFTMLSPFAYLSATQRLDKEPIEYSAGDKFKLSYLIVVYPGIKSAESIQSRYSDWTR